jgi:hypothetical protein
MARFNEILVGRYNRFIQKLLSMKGEASLFQFSTEMMAVLPFFNGRENRFLEGWSTFGHVRNVVASAGNAGAIRIRNPFNSNLVAVFEKILVGSANTDQPLLQLQSTAADLTPFSVTPLRWDARQGLVSTSLVMSDNAAGPTIALQAKMQGFFVANTAFDFIGTDVAELPLLPGDAIQVQSGVLNQAIIVSWLWRERMLEESEIARLA